MYSLKCRFEKTPEVGGGCGWCLTLHPDKWAKVSVGQGQEARIMNVDSQNLSEDQTYMAFVGLSLVFIENVDGNWKIR